MNILQVNSSARREASQSTRLAAEVVARLCALHPGATLTVRDLARTPHPVLDHEALQALGTPAEQRTGVQAARVAADDALIAELQAADVVVIGAPMYNFGITAQLKSWIDAIARARVTFRYTDTGVEGLLTGKKVYVVLTRGGVHRDRPTDSQVPYLRTVLGFLGMSDVEFIYGEGFALGPDAVAQAIAAADAQIERAVAAARRRIELREALGWRESPREAELAVA